jgi:hypothetical protein
MQVSRPASWPASLLTGALLAATVLIAAVATAPATALAQTAYAQAAEAPASAQTRLIQVSQIDIQGELIGAPNEVACPSSGCQTIVDLTVATLPEPFLFSVEFVGRGAYVTLSPRSIATAAVLEFSEGHQGAIFVPLRDRDRQQVTLSFIVVRSATLRALQPNKDADVLASGRVFNRKRTPDLTLRVTISPPGQ